MALRLTAARGVRAAHNNEPTASAGLSFHAFDSQIRERLLPSHHACRALIPRASLRGMIAGREDCGAASSAGSHSSGLRPQVH
jgi:hypothetical protein